MLVNGFTTVFASVAYPNKGTKSPQMHNAGFRELGINSVYVAFETQDIASAIVSMRNLGIGGYSISKPHKQTVIEYLDQVDDTAREIGAVNIVHNREGVIKGYNSDWIGAIEALKEKISLSGKTAILVGAGGAARAIAYGLTKNGVRVSVYNRTVENARKLKDDFDLYSAGTIEDLNSAGNVDIVINATTVGSNQSDDTPHLVPEHLLTANTTVMDAVFMPKNTALLKHAKSNGCQIVDGIRMLVLQGVFTFELFTNKEAPIDIMQDTLEQALST